MGTDGLCVDVNMVGTWMLCGNTDAGCKHWKNTRKRKNLTIKHTGLCVDVNMVGTWMLCGNTDAGCKHWKEHRKTQKPHDKTHQNAAYLQKTHTITPAMCKKHRRMPGKIRRAHLLMCAYIMCAYICMYVCRYAGMYVCVCMYVCMCDS